MSVVDLATAGDMAIAELHRAERERTEIADRESEMTDWGEPIGSEGVAEDRGPQRLRLPPTKVFYERAMQRSDEIKRNIGVE